MYQLTNKYDAIAALQQMLRTIQIASGIDVTIPVDGIYGNATKSAVRNFQEQYGLPITGEVDKRTHDEIYEAFLIAEFELSEPLPLPAMTKGMTLRSGETGDVILIAQIILNALTYGYDDMTPMKLDGKYDERLTDSVRRFQIRNNLTANGEVDKATWNALVRNYEKYKESSE